MMFICMISFSMYRPLGLVSSMFEVFYRYLYCTLIGRMSAIRMCIDHLGFLYIVVVFLATCFVVSAVKSCLYTSVDVILEFFIYHVWLWWFLWWFGHLAIGLRHMFSIFYCWVFHCTTWFVCTFMIQWEAVVHCQIPSAEVFFFFSFGSSRSCHQGGVAMNSSLVLVWALLPAIIKGECWNILYFLEGNNVFVLCLKLSTILCKRVIHLTHSYMVVYLLV